MKIKSVEPIIGFWVDVLDGENIYNYVRYGADSWMVRMGESYESVYLREEEELEELYQEYLSNVSKFANGPDSKYSFSVMRS